MPSKAKNGTSSTKYIRQLQTYQGQNLDVILEPFLYIIHTSLRLFDKSTSLPVMKKSVLIMTLLVSFANRLVLSASLPRSKRQPFLNLSPII
jgi:hypothetical protein